MTVIDKKLLEILACPACDDRPRLYQEPEGLHCAQCGRTYPIVDGIPVLLVEEAVVNKKSETPEA
jgi:hypothetical protein